MKRHAKWFKQRAGRCIDLVRKWKAGAGSNDDLLAQAALVRIESAEVNRPTEVRITTLAQIALAAWKRRIHCNPRALCEGIPIAVQSIRADLFNDPREFMTENQWRLHDGIADLGVTIGVKVAAAYPDGGNAHKCFSATRSSRLGKIVDTKVTGTMEANGLRVSFRMLRFVDQSCVL
jgi:hypothetical protein